MTLNEVNSYWFPNRYYQEKWFDGSCDEEIKIKFGELHRKAETGKIIPKNDDERLAMIILLDQFTRNIYRGTKDMYRNDTECYKLARSVISSPVFATYELNQQIFILLPLRHQRKTELLDEVMRFIEERQVSLDPQDLPLLTKFKNATLKDYSKVTDCITDLITLTDKYALDHTVLDDKCAGFTAPNRISDLTHNPVYRNVREFVRNFGDKPIIGISLSGGVDSMVLSYILHNLKALGDIADFVAIHIDYANRHESGSEAKFVEDWCRYFGIRIIIRRIHHMSRASTDRQFYEDETRNIRFATYRYAMERYGISCVMLGHHSDDLAENVLLNIFKGKDILDLFIMAPTMVRDGVVICRPMLRNNKQAIYDLAWDKQIPYLRDTTSEECFRGMMRGTVIPELNRFGGGIIKNIVQTGERSLEWKNIVDRMIMDPMLRSISRYRYGLSFNYDDAYRDLPKVYWVTFLKECFHRNGIRMMTHKNMDVWIRWIQNPEGMLMISNGHLAFVDRGRVYFCNRMILRTLEGQFTAENGKSYNGWQLSIGSVYPELTYENVLNGSFGYSNKASSETHQVSPFVHRNKELRAQYKNVRKIAKYLPKYLGPDDSFVGFIYC